MIKYRLNWVTETKKSGKTYLVLRVKWNNSKDICSFSLGVDIDPAKWNADTSRLKNNTTHGENKVSASLINRKIELYESIVNNIMQECDTISKDTLRHLFLVNTGREVDDADRVRRYCDEYINTVSVKNQWTKPMKVKMTTMARHFLAPDENLTVDRLDADYMYRVQEYLVSLGYKNTYIARVLENIKIIIIWMKKKGYYNGNAMDYECRLRGSRESSRNECYLTWEELIKVYNFRELTISEEQVRDCFCFSCFTSLRYSDLYNLKKSDIYDNRIHIVIQKTTDAVVIELNKYSKALLDKYKDKEYPNNKALPVISNQKMNEILKRVMRKAGVNTPVAEVYYNGYKKNERLKPKWSMIGTHTGRHTFIVNALYMGISPDVIMKWTGHSNYDSMKPYIAIVDKMKEREMSKFDDFGKKRQTKRHTKQAKLNKVENNET